MQNKNSLLKTAIRETDFILLFLSLSVSIYGIIVVYSATKASIPEGALFSRDCRTMLIAVVLGLIVAIGISFIDYNFITKMFPLIGIVCILLMVLLFFFGVGPATRQDVKTWITLGSTGLYFQPSELVKIGFIITFGMHIELVHDRINQIRQLIFLCLHAMIPVMLVIITGDLGSALVFIIICVTMLFCAGVQLRYFVIAIAAVGAASPAIWYFLFSDTQKNRILGLFTPELYEDVLYQQNRGMEAIRTGGLTGEGLFNGTYTQAGIVPESENDMIFTGLAEELGLIGCIAALALLLTIVVRIMFVGKNSKMQATSLMCYGMAAMIASQVIINIGMCLKIFPVVGITLPFFSAGGSSNICIYIGIGLILSIYRFDKEKEVVNFRLTNITPFGN